MQAKQFNPQVFLEFLSYFVFGGLLFYFVYSERYLLYVTPRMKPYLYFAAIVMIVWAITVLFRMFRSQHKTRSAHCFVLVIPILLLFLPHSQLDSNSLSGKYVLGGSPTSASVKSATNTPESNTSTSTSSSVADQPTLNPDDLSAANQTDITSVPNLASDTSTYELPGLDEANKKIVVSNDDFSLWLTELYANMEHYQDYTVVMTGYVFRDEETFLENEFVPARLMMSCCTADLAPTGFICTYEQTPELEADSWVSVEGTMYIGQYEYDGTLYDEPRILVSSITPAQPVDEYVYPYY